MVTDAIDWTGCPIVEQNPKKIGGRSTVRDWRMPADQVVENHHRGATEQDIAEWYELPVKDVHAIIAYAEKARRRCAHLFDKKLRRFLVGHEVPCPSMRV